MNQLADDKKINLFYLKDMILKANTSIHEKLDALSKIKKNAHLPVYKLAVEALLIDLHKINDTPIIQIEIANSIGSSEHTSLI